MGFILAAFIAGSRPKIRPIRMENAAATMMAGMLMAVGVFMALESS